MAQKFIVYELNEVPWTVIDDFVKEFPNSTLARILPHAYTAITTSEDPAPLQPWRTWSTLHTSSYTADHGSMDLGQDPVTFRGVPVWEAALNQGKRIGLLGPLQSWPPVDIQNGGFYIPDTFSRDDRTYPANLQPIQHLNLRLTRDNVFSPDARLPLRAIASGMTSLVSNGLSAKTVSELGMQLLHERTNKDILGRRSIFQATVMFDVFWRLYKRERPDLAIFFSNHVAGMMHRYWSDHFSPSASRERPSRTTQHFIPDAMRIFDRHLAIIKEWVDRDANTSVIVTSSMGQDQIPKDAVDECFVLDDAQKLLAAFDLNGDVGIAMYPRTTIAMNDSRDLERLADALDAIHTDNGGLFYDINITGKTISFAIDQYDWNRPRTRGLSVRNNSRHNVSAIRDIADLGVVIRRRLGGGNTAYHVPEGSFIAYGVSWPEGDPRVKVSVLDIAPSILELMGVAPPASYRGVASLPVVA